MLLVVPLPCLLTTCSVHCLPCNKHISIISRQRSAISSRPLLERTDFGPTEVARQTHLCPSQLHYGLHPAMFSGNDSLFYSEYYQILIATYLPTPEGWKAELAGAPRV